MSTQPRSRRSHIHDHHVVIINNNNNNNNINNNHNIPWQEQHRAASSIERGESKDEPDGGEEDAELTTQLINKLTFLKVKEVKLETEASGAASSATAADAGKEQHKFLRYKF